MLCILLLNALFSKKTSTGDHRTRVNFLRMLKSLYSLSLAMILLPLSGYTQATEVPLSISPLIGPKIDKQEYFAYGFNEWISLSKKDMDYAEIFLSQESNFVLIVHKKDGKELSQLFNQPTYSRMEDKISILGRPLLQKIEQAASTLSTGEPPFLKIVLENQNNLSGKLTEKRENSLIIQSEFGELEIPIEDIEEISMEGLDFDPAYRFRFENPNATRYLFAPSAIPLKKGEGYYQNVWVTLNSVNYGVSDHVSITGGIELISTFASLTNGYGGPIAFANLKVGTRIMDNVYVGGGVLAAGVLGLDESGGMAMGYGLLTVGNTDNNATLGVGYGLVNGNLSNRPTIVLSGMTRASDRLAFVSENWFVSSRREERNSFQNNQYNYSSKNTYGAVSGAFRIMGDKITFDIGLIGFFDKFSRENNSIENGVSYVNSNKGTEWVPIPIPYLDLVYKF